jgi:hypothetical protein
MLIFQLRNCVTQKCDNISDMPLETIKKYYRVHRKDVSFLRFVFEACEGIVIMTTIDPEKAIVMLCIPPGCESDVRTVLEGMNIRMEEIPDKESV